MSSRMVVIILLAAASSIVVVPISGCLDTPKSPVDRITSIPKIIFDYNTENRTSTFYIHGLDDKKYTKMEFHANDEEYLAYDTFCLLFTVKNETVIDLSGEVADNEYSYVINITVSIENTTVDDTTVWSFIMNDHTFGKEKEIDVKEKDLPWKYTMELKRPTSVQEGVSER